jgi:hypothetical protein
MRNLILSLVTLALLSACNQKQGSTTGTGVDSAGNVVAPADAPVIKFEKELYDFGVITEGESVEHEFKFKNEGKTPLIISDATATCGCTVPEYPTKPIKPGDGGIIKVVFNSQGKVGVQDKVVSITSNSIPFLATLHVVGEVKAKK